MMGQVVEARPPAVQRIFGIPAIGDRAEARLERIVEQQPADEALAEAEQLLDHFDRGEAADHAGDRAENAGLGARRDRPFRRRLGEQAAIRRARIAGCVASRRRGRW